MIVVLLVAITGTAVSGWLLTTDAFWGSPVLQHVHSLLAHGVVALVVVHLAGVSLASLRHHENLARAMVVGVKRAAPPGPATWSDGILSRELMVETQAHGAPLLLRHR